MLLRRVGRPGLLGLAARTAVVAGTASAVSGAMSRRQQSAQQRDAEAAAYEQAAQTLVPAAAPAGSDVVSQLERLASLQAQGVLTPEEFAAQKSRILAGG
ncbi:MAG: SHOCT domain-containing protein [Aeromicrobium sp.]